MVHFHTGLTPGNLRTIGNAITVLDRHIPHIVGIPFPMEASAPFYSGGSAGQSIMASQDGRYRKNILPGVQVRIVPKQDQTNGRMTEGIVREVLTRSSFHPHGIKVRLDHGQVGRVKETGTHDG